MSISAEKNHHGNLSPEFAILGMLYGGPLHGYDLHRRLVTDLGQVWHLSQSQAYAILKRLEQHGDIFGEQIPQAKLPSKQLLHLSPTGRQRFMDWMKNPSGGSIRAIRMEFLTRLYFTRKHEPEHTERVVAAQQTETRKHIVRLENIREQLPVEQVFNRMSLEMRLRQLNLVLAWLEDCKKTFGTQNPV